MAPEVKTKVEPKVDSDDPTEVEVEREEREG